MTPTPERRHGGFLPAVTLCRRELVRFYRQKSRIAGVIGSPLIFWFLIGSGLGTSFRTGGLNMNYLEYFFPGTIVLIMLFTSIFSTISIIEDRREGFMQSVVVSPAPRWSIALGKILGGTTLSLLQAVLLLAATPFLGMHPTVLSVALGIVTFAVVSFGLTGLGFVIAWNMESSQGFHAIMNLFLIPLWLLSGALFPASGAAPWLQAVMMLNPLSYGITAVRETLYLDAPARLTEIASLPASFAVIAAFAFLMFVLSTIAVKRPSKVHP